MDILGVELTDEQANELAYWIQMPDGKAFWDIIKMYRDGAHDRASRPAGSLYKTGGVGGGSRMIPMEVLDAMSRENLAKENAFDIVLDTKNEIKNTYEAEKNKK